jgi:hypothetical protein
MHHTALLTHPPAAGSAHRRRQADMYLNKYLLPEILLVIKEHFS